MQGELYPERVPQQQVGDLDAWYTRRKLAAAGVALMLLRGFTGIALEGHVGAGAWANEWTEQTGTTVQVGDKNPGALGLQQKHRTVFVGDFLEYFPAEEDRPDVVIGNPPYSKENNVGVEHVRHAIRIARQGVGFILPSHFLANGPRYLGFHRHHPVTEAGPVVPRPAFGPTSGAHEVWFCMWDLRPGAVRRPLHHLVPLSAPFTWESA